MEKNWTKQQKEVIESRGESLLVSAAAGSGKTAVLVERIIGMVTDEKDPVDIDRILVVTFTRAAAREMKDRIYKELSALSAKDPGNIHLARQVTLAFGAPISTIDSFASTVVSSYYYCIGLTPEMRMGDEGELRLLAEQTMDEMMEDEYEKASEGFLALTLAYRAKERDTKLVSLISDLYKNSMSHPYPEDYLDGLCAPYEITDEKEIESLPFVTAVTEQTRVLLGEVRQMQKDLLEELKAAGDGSEHPYEATILSDMAGVERLMAAGGFNELCKAFPALSWNALSRKKAGYDDSGFREDIKNKRNAIKDRVQKLGDLYSKSPEDILKEAEAIRPYVREIVRLTKRYIREYGEAKLKKKIMDFADIEHFALDILMDKATGEPTAIARSYRDFYHEVMVDEYQDSNLLQEMLLSAISDEKSNYFMVGDVKQSIYSFRQARPDIFTGKYKEYGIGQVGQHRIDLSLNFRSRKEVLDITNDTFTMFMDEKLGLVEYDEAARLVCGASYEDDDGMESELCLIPKDDPLLEEEDITPVELEARLVGQKIREYLNSGRFALSDIAVLHRNANKQGQKIAEVLGEMGIPASLPARSGYFDAPEVEVMLSLLSVISNPYDDVTLCSALTSPVGGFTKDELLLIRNIERKKAFANVFLDTPEEEFPESVRGKRDAFINKLTDFREKAANTPIDELLEYIYEETGYLRYVTGLPGGEERRANLEELSDMAVSFAGTSYQGIFHFIRYIEKLRKYEVEEGGASSGGGDGSVSIMTIHKSKGLEYPLVFICGMGEGLTGRESETVLHPEYGLGLTYYDPGRSVRCRTFYRSALSYLLKNERLGEEMRVLYVAMTRAKEKLIMTATMDDSKIDDAMDQSPVSVMKLPLVKRLSASTYADLVIPAFLQDRRRDCFQKVSVPDLINSEIAFESTRKGREELAVLLSKNESPDELADRIKSRTSFSYTKGSLYPWKSKYSVSMLKHQAMEQAAAEEEALSERIFEEEKEIVSYVPRFMGGEASVNMGAERGTAMHRFLECFDFGLEDMNSGLESEIERELGLGLITEDQRKLLLKGKLKRFLESPLAKRMHRAYQNGDLIREQAFVMGGEPEEFFGDITEGDEAFSDTDPMILIQGIIDAYFIEDGQVYIVDYKTDRADSPEEIETKYSKQMRLYADALSKGMDLEVGGLYLYSFTFDRVIEVKN